MAFIGNTVTTQGFTPAVDFFSGNASTTAFTLSKPVASVAQVQAVIENVPQNPGSAYTVSGNTITFTSAPPSGTNNIYVYYTSPITQVIQPSQGTVGLTQLSATGTASSSTYLRGDNTWATVSVSPAGSTTQLQYNNAGSFGGISGVTTDGTRVTNSTTTSVGGATPSTSGVGITYPATQNLSTNANTLDDYQEGSYTGTLTGCTTSPTTTVYYTKVGNIVHLNNLAAGVTGTSNASTMRLTGMPALIRPANSSKASVQGGISGSVSQTIWVQVLSNGDLYCEQGGNSWPTSGVKGFDSGFGITYSTY